MNKIINYLDEKRYLLGAMFLDLAALVTLITDGGSFHFWMLIATSLVLQAIHEFFSIVKKNSLYNKNPKTIWYTNNDEKGI